ncbi:MAG TPA: ABC transporter ATP-binding protein [Longimicrobiaceae bacterium]|nr:ABC transporter ATP-binding protein [Longimicrobiaceae bacterium]
MEPVSHAEGAPPVLAVRGLVKTYAKRRAVDGLSFVAAPGEVLGLVGPNGAGKTTTLRTIAGILPVESGTVAVAGHDLVRQPVEARRRLALVPDNPQLFEQLSVWEHLDFTARLYGVAQWQPRAVRLLDELELGDRRDSLADELSRGMRQKLALACALVHDPAVLLLDEPLTGLDPRGIRTLFDLVRRRAAEGAAVVLSSHLLGQIESLCSHVLIVRQGRRVFGGSKAELRAEFPQLGPDASLEELFFHAVEGAEPAAGA